MSKSSTDRGRKRRQIEKIKDNGGCFIEWVAVRNRNAWAEFLIGAGYLTRADAVFDDHKLAVATSLFIDRILSPAIDISPPRHAGDGGLFPAPEAEAWRLEQRRGRLRSQVHLGRFSFADNEAFDRADRELSELEMALAEEDAATMSPEDFAAIVKELNLAKELTASTKEETKNELEGEAERRRSPDGEDD